MVLLGGLTEPLDRLRRIPADAVAVEVARSEFKLGLGVSPLGHVARQRRTSAGSLSRCRFSSPLQPMAGVAEQIADDQQPNDPDRHDPGEQQAHDAPRPSEDQHGQREASRPGGVFALGSCAGADDVG